MSKNNILTLIITLIITSSCATTELNKEKSEREVQRDKKLNELEQICDYVTIDIYPVSYTHLTLPTSSVV